MTDLSDPPATHPPGTAFLELGERLRQRGQLEAAATVALAGLAHFPALADAHDLLGRIRADQRDDAAAISAWNAALECDPHHIGARKGLAFVAFRAHDTAAAERHLELAAADSPHDTTLIAALDRVRASRPVPAANDLATLDDPASGILLFDTEGMRLAGGVGPGSDAAAADATAAEAAGLVRETERTARLLGLGNWRYLMFESVDTRCAVLPTDPPASLLVRRNAATPAGRLLATAARAALLAREWLGRMT